MTAPVFVDTSALIALISRSDAWHDSARAQFASLAERRRPLLTSTAVLYELLDGAATRGPMRQAALQLVSSVRLSPQWTIVHVSEGHLLQAEALFASRMDKPWSLTDCTNMGIAREHAVVEVLSSDDDFEQAGFTLLLHS